MRLFDPITGDLVPVVTEGQRIKRFRRRQYELLCMTGRYAEAVQRYGHPAPERTNGQQGSQVEHLPRREA